MDVTMIKKIKCEILKWKIAENGFVVSLYSSPISNDVKTNTLQLTNKKEDAKKSKILINDKRYWE